MVMSKYLESKVIRKLLISLFALVLVFVFGSVGYHLLGAPQNSWMDCIYMVFLTVTTIGFHEAVDLSAYEYGRLFTIFVGITGIGVLGYVLSTVTAFMLEGNLMKSGGGKKWKKRSLN